MLIQQFGPLAEANQLKQSQFSPHPPTLFLLHLEKKYLKNIGVMYNLINFGAVAHSLDKTGYTQKCQNSWSNNFGSLYSESRE